MKIVYFNTSMWTMFPDKIGNLKLELSACGFGESTYKVKGKPADVDTFLDANKDKIIKINRIIKDHKVEEIKELIREKNVIISVYEPRIKAYDEEINKRKSKLTKKQLMMLEEE